MRQTPARAEQKLWACLRNRQLGGFKFRRQFAVERYIADFYCAACKLVIEIDGESHMRQQAYDADRTAALAKCGYRVIRYSNVDVHENLQGVLLDILQECDRHRGLRHGPSPLPSPLITGERGQERP